MFTELFSTDDFPLIERYQMSLNSATVRENSPLIDAVHQTSYYTRRSPSSSYPYCQWILSFGITDVTSPPVRTGWGGLISPNLKAFPSVYRFNSPKFLGSGAFRTTCYRYYSQRADCRRLKLLVVLKSRKWIYTM